MLVEIKVKEDVKNVRIQAIKDFRALTGCSLKESMDTLPDSMKKGTVLKVQAAHGQEKMHYDTFTVIDSSSELKDKVKELISIAVDADQFDLAQILVTFLKG